MCPGLGQNVFHGLSLVLGQLLIEVPVGEQASLEGRDCSGDVAFGNGHLLLIEVFAAGELFHKHVAEDSEGRYGPGGLVDIPLQGRSLVPVIRLHAGEGEFPGHLDQGDLIRERSIGVSNHRRLIFAAPSGASLSGSAPIVFSRVTASLCDVVGGRVAPVLEFGVSRVGMGRI
ncbi:hypothetical protein DY000_02039886 [Brassica cretica]|uniref:Uncharacterized protein n=1 Tax=Brassica cretica TaxID=69181 RepID=A0ABQ7BQB5_BRACR|nr:hypothetical protein DY000_02039886 [Brassica cretica]